MATVLVTHPASRLPTYFGERALGQLREFAEVRLNPSEQDWQGADLVAATSSSLTAKPHLTRRCSLLCPSCGQCVAVPWTSAPSM
jgi:hypothetical protein